MKWLSDLTALGLVFVAFGEAVTWMPTLAVVPGLVRPPSARDVPPGDAPTGGAAT